MNKSLSGISKIFVMLLVMTLCMNLTVYAQEDDEEDVYEEQQSFTECDGFITEPDVVDQYVDGLYNVDSNARASMTGLIRLYQSGSKITSTYTTTYTTDVDKIGIKNIKLQYKGSLGIWHTIITLDDRYSTNSASYMGSFSCTGVVGRVYRVKGTHYVIDGSYKQERDNVTGELTFK